MRFFSHFREAFKNIVKILIQIRGISSLGKKWYVAEVILGLISGRLADDQRRVHMHATHFSQTSMILIKSSDISKTKRLLVNFKLFGHNQVSKHFVFLMTILCFVRLTSQSTIFQLFLDRSSWVEPVLLSKDKCVLLKDTTQ